MLGLVNRPNDIALSRANQSQAKSKSAVGGNLLQSWVNLTMGTISLLRLIIIYIDFHSLYGDSLFLINCHG